MLPPRLRRALAASLLLPLLSCRRSAPVATEVMITASEYAFVAPETIPAGLVTLRLVNRGTELHHAVLWRLEQGKTLADLQAGLAQAMKHPAEPPPPPPPWLTFLGGPNAVLAGDTAMVTETLAPGNYALVCLIPGPDGVPHVAKGMLRPLVVRAATGPVVPEPRADLEIKLTDYAFAVGPIPAGPHTIRVDNAGPQVHEVELAQLAPGKTPADLVSWDEHGEQGPPPVARWLGGIAPMAAGEHGYITVTLAPGTYLLLCFVPDAKDGKSHIAHGMVREITIS